MPVACCNSPVSYLHGNCRHLVLEQTMSGRNVYNCDVVRITAGAGARVRRYAKERLTLTITCPANGLFA